MQDINVRHGLPPTTAAVLAGAGASGVAAATAGIYALDRRGVAAGFDVVHHTLSEAAWRPGGLWFCVALEVLAVGTAAVALGLGMLGEARRSARTWLLTASGGLVLAGIVPTNRPLTPTVPSTYVHLGAIVLAAAVLPLGAVAAARTRPGHRPRPAAAAATVLAIAALPAAAYVTTVAVSSMIAAHDWQPLPLGTVQRLLAADESLIIIALGVHTVLRTRQVRLWSKGSNDPLLGGLRRSSTPTG